MTTSTQPKITVEWDDDAADDAVRQASDAAASAGAEALLRESSGRAPVLTGALKSSGRVVTPAEHDGKIEAAVAYDASYAPILRAHPEWDYTTGQGDFLDAAIESSGASIGRDMEDAARAAWPSG
jgi:hypothetical protein